MVRKENGKIIIELNPDIFNLEGLVDLQKALLFVLRMQEQSQVYQEENAIILNFLEDTMFTIDQITLTDKSHEQQL